MATDRAIERWIVRAASVAVSSPSLKVLNHRLGNLLVERWIL